MIPNDYITKLLAVLANHPRAICAPALTRIIGGPYTNQKTLEQLHAEINAELNNRNARGSRWNRWIKHTDRHHEALRLALTATMTAQVTLFANQHHVPVSLPTPAVQTPVPLPAPPLVLELPPSTPEQFNREIFLVHVAYTQDDEITMINNAIMELIESYKKHYDLYSQAHNNSKQTKYHAIRLSILNQWATPDGYQILMKAINTSEVMLKNGAFVLSINKADIDKPSQDNQQVLNWLGVVYERFHGSESPYAMSRALEIISLLKKQDEIQSFIPMINQYIAFYIGSDSVAEININNAGRMNLLTNTIRLNEAWHENQHENCKKILSAIRINLYDIYSDLAMLSLNTPQILKEFERLLTISDAESSEHFFTYFDNALNFRARAMESKNKKMTTRSFEPLEAYPTKGLYFTPNDWSLLDGDLTTESKRLSNRSSGRRTSTAASNSDRSDRSARSARSAIENLDQADATPVGSNESSKSKSVQSQLIGKHRLPTQ